MDAILSRFRVDAAKLGMALGLVCLVGGLGCSVELLPFDPPPGAGSDGSIDDDEVLVRFVNLTADDAVNIQFHATNTKLVAVPDDLFVEENLITRDLGLAGSGLLAPRTQDEITFPCTDELTLGTLRGEFLDAQTGDVRGNGVRRWAREAPLGLCGFVVTFEFDRDGDDVVTRIKLGD
ncbi:MAG: hypothetical protein IID38_00265 [Planctomycetes bacterium]|nr:hypothetical protein [Planctomycetota bacterium]